MPSVEERIGFTSAFAEVFLSEREYLKGREPKFAIFFTKDLYFSTLGDFMVTTHITVATFFWDADTLIIGTPTHWGNMSAPLKLLFDRNVPVLMGESPKGMPEPRQKGKRAVVVTVCTTPWPFNFIFPESRGAIRAVREALHYGGYKTVGKITKTGTKKSNEISPSLAGKAKRLGNKLIQR